MISRVGVAADALYARGAIHVGDCTKHLAHFVANADDEYHERKRCTRLRHVEKIVQSFLYDGWCERPVAFALLHHGINDVLESGRPGISKNAAIAESTWSEFGPPLYPTDYRATGKKVSSLFGNFV